ncbi:MAG: hypothetical protein Harvfovirus48_9 [Harvfovirus sp.]|uniref:Uncharacterized protein n=1 Tax=Harvfovirus sp. TaxID=2487768 RepID=A0A3G5A337_9VIRU|nr:MAG: hypothetical protein Harvfovirus48_9 [Harvfovirus sp.]
MTDKESTAAKISGLNTTIVHLRTQKALAELKFRTISDEMKIKDKTILELESKLKSAIDEVKDKQQTIQTFDAVINNQLKIIAELKKQFEENVMVI